MNFGLLVLAETVKIFSRVSARVGLLVSLVVGLAMPLMLYFFLNSGLVVNGVESQDYFAATGTDAVSWSLTVRNFMVVRAFLVVLGAQTLAGELAARTLRESLLRPVARDWVVFAKWFALIVWDASSLVITYLAAAIVGALVLGLDGIWVDVTLATFLNLICDAGVIALVFAIGVLTRSTIATIAGLLVTLVLDKMLGLAMVFASGVAELLETSPVLVKALNSWPLLPSAAFGLWAGVLPEQAIDPRSVASLLLIMAGGLMVTILRLRRMEVP